MNLHEFRAARDEIALASMLQRGRDLETALETANADMRCIKSELAKYPAPASGLQYGLTKEQFDERIRLINIREKLLTELDAAQRVWAGIDAAIGDIVRDTRYRVWADAQRRIA